MLIGGSRTRAAVKSELFISVFHLPGSSESSTPSVVVDTSPTSPPYPLSCPNPSLSLPDALAYPLHKHAVAGDLSALQRTLLANQDSRQLVNQPMRDGTTAVHCASEAGYDSKGLIPPRPDAHFF